MFDLNENVKQWRNELLSGDSVSAVEADELENHLRETFGDLQSKLDSADEAFWLAVHRIGSPDAVSHEFSKINTAHTWRRRAIWMLTGYLLLSVLRGGVGVFDSLIGTLSILQSAPLWLTFVASSVGFTALLVGVTYWTWNASHGRSLGMQGFTISLGNRARSGKHASIAFLAALAWLIPMTLNFGINVAASRVMTPADFGLTHVANALSSLPKGGLFFGMTGALLCWLAQQEGNIEDKADRGQFRIGLVLMALAAAVLLGFALLSYGVGPLYGNAYAIGG